MKNNRKQDVGRTPSPLSNILKWVSSKLTIALAFVALISFGASAQITQTDPVIFQDPVPIPCSLNNPVEVSGAVTDVTCFGYENGEIDLSVNGGHGPYHYLWSNGATTQDLEELAPGSYSVDVYDAFQCHATAWFLVGQPTQLELEIVLTEPACGQPSGCAIMSGGTPPYQLHIFSGPLSDPTPLPVPDIQLDELGNISVNNLSPITDVDFLPNPNDPHIRCADHIADGEYLVLLTDANGCYTYEWVIVEGNSISIHAEITEPLCFGDSNGSIQIEIEGGTPPYSCNWAVPLENNDPNSDELEQIDPQLIDNCSLNHIPAGTYFLFIEDANGCTVTRTIHVGQPSELQLEVNLEYPTCGGQPSGCAFMSGGTAPYSLFVYTDVIVDPAPDVIVDLDGNVIVDALSLSDNVDFLPHPNNDHTRCADHIADGLYLVLLVDANGCFVYQYVEVQGTDGLSINLDFNQYGEFACAFPEGGAASYTISWSDLSGDILFPAISQECVYELAEGVYSVTVTDAHGCSETEIFIIDAQPCHAGFAEVVPSEIWSGMNTTFVLSNFSGVSIQWQFRTQFTEWLNVPNGTTAEFETPNIYVASDKEIGVRALVTCANGEVLHSNVAMLTVYAIESQQFVSISDPELFGAQITGISTIDAQIDLTVYPSPTTGPITLISNADQSDLEITITDLNGRVLSRSLYQPTISGQRLEMDITGNTPGVYLIRLRSDRGTRTERIILR